MSRRAKIAIGLFALVVALVGINALVTSSETKSAELTAAHGKVLDLPAGDLQVVSRGRPNGPAIVLIHCFTCAIDWWDRMIPRLERGHRVIAIDLLGHGGSEKPDAGYSIENQAELVSQALQRLGVRRATVVGHSLGATVAVALSETAPEIAHRVVIIGQAPDSDGYGADLPITAAMTFTPVIGEALWRIAPDFAIENGLAVAFAPEFDVPTNFVDDFRRLTYTAYDESADGEREYTDALPLDARLRRTGTPVMAIFGAEEQIYDPKLALMAYGSIPGAEARLIQGAGHSPNVERPLVTALLVMRFADRNKMGRPNGRPR